MQRQTTAQTHRYLPARLRATVALLQVLRLTAWFGFRAWWAQRRSVDVTVGQRFAARWADALTSTLSLDIRHHGLPAPEASVLVANHRSYLDVVALLHGVPCGMLAKAEVGGFPLVGKAMASAGTTFVQRDHKGSRRAARLALVERVQAGGRAALFPEGTTSAAPGCLAFHPGMFHASASAGFSVQPVAVHYPDTAVPYVDDDHLLSHFLTLFRRRAVRVHVVWGPVLTAGCGVELKQQAEDWVRASLEALQRLDPVAG